jgi:threonine/homoserine/homoserine lactone efflux protein
LNLELYLAFVVATTVMILLPGPSVMLTVAHSLAFGAIRALATVSGAVLAIGFVFTAAWGVAADRTRVWFGGRCLRLRNRIAGSLMIGAGLALATVRRA